MNNSYCYINIEDLNTTGYLPDCVSLIEEEYSDESISTLSCDEQILTLRLANSSFGDIKDFCSFITSTLLELGIHQFSLIYQS
jgi:hypothetical protein